MFDEAKLRQFIVEAVFGAMEKYMPVQVVTPEKKYIHSMQEMADELHMSIVTMQKLKNSGRIPYKQEGRKIIFEVSEVLNAMNVVNGRRVKG